MMAVRFLFDLVSGPGRRSKQTTWPCNFRSLHRLRTDPRQIPIAGLAGCLFGIRWKRIVAGHTEAAFARSC